MQQVFGKRQGFECQTSFAEEVLPVGCLTQVAPRAQPMLILFDQGLSLDWLGVLHQGLTLNLGGFL